MSQTIRLIPVFAAIALFAGCGGQSIDAQPEPGTCPTVDAGPPLSAEHVRIEVSSAVLTGSGSWVLTLYRQVEPGAEPAPTSVASLAACLDADCSLDQHLYLVLPKDQTGNLFVDVHDLSENSNLISAAQATVPLAIPTPVSSERTHHSASVSGTSLEFVTQAVP